MSRAGRTRRRRCVVCCAPCEAWLCDTHGIVSEFWSGATSASSQRPYRPASATRFRSKNTEAGVVIEQTWARPKGGGINPVPKESDPHRWCDECLCHTWHRPDCAVRRADGDFVGGYSSARPAKFKQLEKPKTTWSSHHVREHQWAVRRRWDAFVAQWARIGLTLLAELYTSMASTLRVAS